MTEQIPLIILGSARQHSDTKTYVDYIFNETGHKLADLLNYNVSTYNYDGTYPVLDNFNELTEEILNHDTIVFATPVYWYSMSGLMKNVFDRITDLVTIQKATGRKLKDKNVFLLAVGTDQTLPDGFEIPFKRTSDYLDMNYKGYTYFSTDNICTEEEKSLNRKTFMDMIRKCTHLKQTF